MKSVTSAVFSVNGEPITVNVNDELSRPCNRPLGLLLNLVEANARDALNNKRGENCGFSQLESRVCNGEV